MVGREVGVADVGAVATGEAAAGAAVLGDAKAALRAARAVVTASAAPVGTSGKGGEVRSDAAWRLLLDRRHALQHMVPQ